MFYKFLCAVLLSLSLMMSAYANVIQLPGNMTESDMKVDIPQPYIVKKGDTLWDIANYFFKDPEKWIHIWEQNLYITNPDLIYPGNKIWFHPPKTNEPQQAQATMKVERPHPTVIIKPVERLSPPSKNKMLLTALTHQDFISPQEEKGVGYLLDARDERLNFGIHDMVYLKLNRAAQAGERFDIFRDGDPVYDLKHHKVVGVLVQHLGTVTILSQENGVYRGQITRAFKEIMRGDRIKPAKHIDTQITPEAPTQAVSARVLYIQNHGTAAGQNQVIGINAGLNDGLKTGSILAVYRPGRRITDQTQDESLTLPDEHIADIVVMKVQPHASLAMVTYSTAAIHLGDLIRNPQHQP